jgi:hypothetical protein
MKTFFDPSLKAHLTTDEHNTVRLVQHSEMYWESEASVPRHAAAEYLHAMATTLSIPASQLTALHMAASHDSPREQGVDFRLSETKQQFDSTTIGYAQTFFNVPVWRQGLSITMKDNPTRVVACANQALDGLHGKLPAPPTVNRMQSMIMQSSRLRLAQRDGLGEAEGAPDPLLDLLPLSNENTEANAKDGVHVLSSKLYAYRYEGALRFGGRSAAGEAGEPKNPQLPALPDSIEEGRTYLVNEIIFEAPLAGFGNVVWLVLVEVETQAILYVECMTHGVNGLVFRRDPQVKTGNVALTSDDSNADLNPHRDDVLLNDLDAPVAGTQALRGRFVVVQNVEDPNIPPPTQGAGVDFDYEVRTNEFGAVNAYYHQTELFRRMEGLGFNIATYFNGTTFPIPVDHRGLGNQINAHWSPNGSGGTAHMCYGLGDTTNLAQPLCRAVDPWVHWHEMGGHGTLGDHVNSGTFGFAHSAGDGLAALQMDPESALRGTLDRFRYAPFRPSLTRRFDRPVATWAWSGANDDRGYGSEEILATCHFRMYRAIGGDHPNVNRRNFASDVATYLILRATGDLTPGTNPNSNELWCARLQATDLLNWTSRGLYGGAYNKVIRWAFEKQGSFQPAGAPTPVTTAGAAPAVDVYIDDGRAGEYQFQEVHWHNTSMWNRNAADGLPGHQDAIQGQNNYMYVKVKNRGTATANNVSVKAFHTLPGAGLVWPLDFTAMSPAVGLNVASIGPNHTQEVIVGPFEWTPNINAYGHDCVLMIASAPGDPSNIDNFTVGETIEEWRLVPNDNNIGQRNVNVVPGEGRRETLMAWLHQRVFWVRNSMRRRARMEVKVSLPPVMAKAGWQMRFEGLGADNSFMLAAGEKRKLVIELVPGAAFTPDDVRAGASRDINVEVLAAGMPLGGMIYRLDPDKSATLPPKAGGGSDCNDKAAALLDCLKLGGAKVSKVCVKKVSLDIQLDHDCGCD